MTKTILILAIVASFMIGSSMSFVLSNYEAEAGEPKPPKPPKPPKEVIVANTDPIPISGSISANPECPAENVLHWDTWSYRYSGELTHLTNPTIPTSQPQLLKFKVDPTVSYWPRAEIVDRLNELGYTLSSTGGMINPENLSTHTFESSTIICAEN